jgi:hypothetical protein
MMEKENAAEPRSLCGEIFYHAYHAYPTYHVSCFI